MKVDTLEAYNVPPDIIEVWRNHVGPELLPVQERAVKEFGLFGTDNLIVFSPTSSGKTFIGEMAAVKAARENTKVFYLVPAEGAGGREVRGAAAPVRAGRDQRRRLVARPPGVRRPRSSAAISRSRSSCSRSCRRCWSATRS